MGVTCEGMAYWPISELDSRIRVRFDIRDSILKINARVPFIIDTGATTVAIPFSVLHLGMDARRKIISSGDVCAHLGVSNNIHVKYYKWNLEKFCLGDSIVLRNFPVHITFDEHVSMCLVGMSFLKLFNVFIQPEHRTIMFTALKSTEAIVTGRASADSVESLQIPYIGIDEVDSEETESLCNRMSGLNRMKL